jgi:hypothetical protein
MLNVQVRRKSKQVKVRTEGGMIPNYINCIKRCVRNSAFETSLPKLPFSLLLKAH